MRRDFPGGIVVRNPPPSEGDTRDVGSIPESGRYPGVGNDNPLQYSHLENPMDREAWLATVHSVAKNWTQQLLSHVQLFAIPWTVAHESPLSVEFSRQEDWSGLPFPSPGDLPDLGMELESPTLRADSLSSKPPGKPAATDTRTHIINTLSGEVLKHQDKEHGGPIPVLTLGGTTGMGWKLSKPHFLPLSTWGCDILMR